MCAFVSLFGVFLFLSTLSLRRATLIKNHIVFHHSLFLSTLSLRRATSSKIISSSIIAYFYPRSPCGERLLHCTTYLNCSRFLSTLSLRRATNDAINGCNPDFISIHALLAESDERADSFPDAPPEISIHALLAESDSKSAQNSGALLRIWNKFYGDCIFMLTGKAVFYPFCPCFFHIFWCEGSGNFMIAFPSH